jgi:hypothetical protein
MAIETEAEYELALERLLSKLDSWLVNQEEWPLVFGSDRQARKRAATLLAKEILTIPKRQFETPQVNRGVRRRIIRELAHQEREWFAGVEEE